MVFKNIHVLPKAGVREVAREGQAGSGRRAAGGAGEPRPGGLHLLGLRRLPRVHARQDQRQRRPELDDLSASYDEAKAAGKTKATDLAGFIKESIVEPNAFVAKGFAPGIMPQEFGSNLSPKQIDDLAAYLAKGGSG